MIGCILDHLWGPMHAAPCIIPAKDRHDHSIVGSDVFKSAKNPCGNVENIPMFQCHFARVPIAPPEKAPAA